MMYILYHIILSTILHIHFSEDNTYKDVVVEIERTTRKKPFLGGYRHKKTSVEYHHASAQTMQKPRAPSGIERTCRDTQTVEQHHRVQQTTNDMATQMTGIGVYVSNMEDKLISPNKYTTADEHHDMILRKVCVIVQAFAVAGILIIKNCSREH